MFVVNAAARGGKGSPASVGTVFRLGRIVRSVATKPLWAILLPHKLGRNDEMAIGNAPSA